MTKVKVCCIRNINEARLAFKYGATAIGFVSSMPSGPGVIKDEIIRSIISRLPCSTLCFLLSSKTNSIDLISQLEYTQANTLQIVDYVEDEVYKDLREFKASINIVQVIHVMEEDDIEKAMKVSKFVDMLLLDSGNPNSRIKTLGGTGKTHNWDLSKRIVDEVEIPVFLAGGLHKKNVKEAIDRVNPYGVDLCSGIRMNGLLIEKKLKSFMGAVI